MMSVVYNRMHSIKEVRMMEDKTEAEAKVALEKGKTLQSRRWNGLVFGGAALC